jgi:hypothetical protein
MSMGQDPGLQTTHLVRRMRTWSASSWRHRDRLPRTREALQELADLAAAREGRPRIVVPNEGEAALADQLAVLVADAQRCGVQGDQIADVLERLTSTLGVRT